MTAETLELRYVPLETLRRWDRNAKKHDLGALVESIERHGFRDPPAYDASLNGGEGGVVEGNGRGDALSAMLAEGRPVPRGIVAEGGTWLVPVLFGVDAPSQAAAEAYGVAHNQLTLAGGDFTALDMASLWEPAGYAALLEDLARQGEIPVGMDGDDVDALLRELVGVEPGQGGDEFDATPQDGPTRAQSGDLWIIGGVHRLVVGDSTDPATVARLMGGERADMVFTDPPYNHASEDDGVAAPVSKAHASLMEADWDRDFEWSGAAKSIDMARAENCTVYVCASWHTAGDIWAWMRATRSNCNGYCVWHKPNPMPSLMKRHWTWASELICYATYGRHTFNFPVTGHAPNVWEVTKVSDGSHPTQKPVALVGHAIEHSSKADNVVLDLFLGSGTTLIAAHRTGRRCYGVEIEPRYADVILRRAEAEGLTVERAP